VVIDPKTLSKFEEQMEDLFDGIIAESRRDEASTSWEEIKKNLKKKRRVSICTL